jgi:uncharacterized protein YqeY
MIESNIECGQLEENIILEQFLPQQLTEADIIFALEVNKFNSIKECMQFFKETYAGQYDGKQVNKLFNNK